jgi:hypothetical protein
MIKKIGSTSETRSKHVLTTHYGSRHFTNMSKLHLSSNICRNLRTQQVSMLVLCFGPFLHILVDTRTTGCITQWLRFIYLTVLSTDIKVNIQSQSEEGRDSSDSPEEGSMMRPGIGRFFTLLKIYTVVFLDLMHAVAQMVEMLCYKSEGCGSES